MFNIIANIVVNVMEYANEATMKNKLIRENEKGVVFDYRELSRTELKALCID